MTQNKYYFQALDNFPYNMQETIEALNYALSYEGQNAESLCLLGRVYAEVLKDYVTAKDYSAEALQENMDSVSTPIPYIYCLINNDDFSEAEKLIDFALKIKGIDKATIYYQKSVILEKKGQLKLALKEVKMAKVFTYNENFMNFLDTRKDFIKKKMKDSKPKKSKKNENKKAKPKKADSKK